MLDQAVVYARQQIFVDVPRHVVHLLESVETGFQFGAVSRIAQTGRHLVVELVVTVGRGVHRHYDGRRLVLDRRQIAPQPVELEGIHAADVVAFAGDPVFAVLLGRVDKDQVVEYDVEYNEDGTLKPNQEYKAGENGYTYKTDANGNISSAHADELKFKTHDGRLNHNSNTAGKLPGDDAGHLFADQFGGSPDLDNLVSQRSDLNRAVKNTDNYRSMEREWSNALKNGQNVTDVDIKLSYKNGSSRPSSFNVSYKIDGELFRRIFKQ